MQGKQKERKKTIKPFSKTCWPRLVKQHQGAPATDRPLEVGTTQTHESTRKRCSGSGWKHEVTDTEVWMCCQKSSSTGEGMTVWKVWGTTIWSISAYATYVWSQRHAQTRRFRDLQRNWHEYAAEILPQQRTQTLWQVRSKGVAERPAQDDMRYWV